MEPSGRLEIEKTISLRLGLPDGEHKLTQLKQDGSCTFDLSQQMFDEAEGVSAEE